MSELPDDMLQILTELHQDQDTFIQVNIRPVDAYFLIGVIQFATRNPHLTEAQRDIVVQLGRNFQRGLLQVEPRLESLLEAGWNPENDS